MRNLLFNNVLEKERRYFGEQKLGTAGNNAVKKRS